MSLDKKQTIEDFGNQWNIFTENNGYYGSTSVLVDICDQAFNTENFKGARVLDIGAGTGRLTNILIDLGADHVYSVEPSRAYDVLLKETARNSNRITYINTPGDEFPLDINVDIAMSIGVLHHIPEPDPVCARVYEVLNVGGKFLIWVYAQEGNELYLFIFNFVRRFTSKMNDKNLVRFSKFLDFFLNIYCKLCAVIPLPMHTYMRNHIAKLTKDVRVLTIFDQLNPECAKYYTKEETVDLLHRAGFKNIKISYRHKYSWTAVGEK